MGRAKILDSDQCSQCTLCLHDCFVEFIEGKIQADSSNTCWHMNSFSFNKQVGNLRPGMSILIHAGTGGTGQAAINVASHFGCTIFTTVGSREKWDFIRNNFPQIHHSHIGMEL